ncbi:MAG: molybdopterin-dependent oxidoreductase [bacterium]
MQCVVNGQKIEVAISSGQTLLSVLRDELGLTGAKNGCGIGICGACTVIMNKNAVRSCIIPAYHAEGKEIITIEGLGTSDHLHLIQQAIIKHNAVQCGYCTPGMILQAKSFLDKNPNPTREQIQQALSGNLCRCTGYQQMIDAIMEAAQLLHNPQLVTIQNSQTETGSQYIGQSIPRVDILEKVIGKTKYTADLTVRDLQQVGMKSDRMLHAKIARSIHSHARLLNIDISQMKQIKGVVTVLTAADIPGNKLYGKAVADQPVLAFDRIRYYGEPIALVVAESEAIAEKALAAIQVEYDVLPGIFDPYTAMNASANGIMHTEDIYSSLLPHSKEVATKNILYHFPIRKGDIATGFALADHIIERTYTTSWVEHACMETEVTIAYYDQQDKLTIAAPSHNVYFDRREIARVLGINKDQLRVIKLPMGASFGKREDIYGQILAAFATYHTKLPVKLVFSRKETFAVTTKRHPMIMRYKTGITKTEKLVAQEIEIIADTGAYASWAPNIIRKAAVHASGPYEIPHVKVDAYAVYTNNIPAGAMRGFGATQVAFAYESNIDEVAKEIGIDAIDLRRKNIFKNGAMTTTNQKLNLSFEPIITLETALEILKTNPKSKIRNLKLKKHGWGIATTFYGIGYGYGIPDIGTAIIEIFPNGKAQIATSAIDYGQGLATIFCQIGAACLGLKLSDVTIMTGDTELTPDSGSTVATRQTYVTGNAVKLAAEKLKDEMIQFIITVFQVSAENIILDNSMIIIDGKNAIPISEIIQQMIDAGRPTKKQARFKPYTQRLDSQTGQGDAYSPYTFGTQLAEVEVDLQTGEVKVLRIIAAHNVGKMLHPENVFGQIYGGISMGLGMALTERFEIHQGKPTTTNFHQYRIPQSTDMPELIPVILEYPDSEGPFGAVGIGEPATIPTAPAIINAIANATGIRVYDLPATPTKIKLAIERNQSKK